MDVPLSYPGWGNPLAGPGTELWTGPLTGLEGTLGQEAGKTLPPQIPGSRGCGAPCRQTDRQTFVKTLSSYRTTYANGNNH